MNSTNTTNGTHVPSASELDPWVESGAMVYVALTVATFSAVMMCCTWFFKEHWAKSTKYSTLSVDEQVELTSHVSDSEEDIDLGLETSPVLSSRDDSVEEQSAQPEPDPSVFSLEDPGDGSSESSASEVSGEEQHELLEDVTATV